MSAAPTNIEVPDVIEPVTELSRVHFIGIGGAGLSGIARLMAQRGVQVSGSDAADSPLLDTLRKEGIAAEYGHDPARLDGVDTVVASTAIGADNPELVRARDLGIRVWPRSAGLQSVLASQRTVAVGGTHGKTTTTAMLVCALQAAGSDPAFAIGAEVPSLGANAAWGSSGEIIAEADESDGAFLVYTPSGVVVTNVEADHLDQWGTDTAYREGFAEFVSHASEFVVLNVDDPTTAQLAGHVTAGIDLLTAGFENEAQLRGTDLVVDASGTRFVARSDGGKPIEVRLSVPGAHYATDALLALGAGLAMGYQGELLADGLTRYTGAARRMQHLGEAGGVAVYDSYAHHPTEITADLAAARAMAQGSRLVVAFQPHLVSRTRIYGEQMGRALSTADEVIVSDIYVAREQPDPQVTAEFVLTAVTGPPAMPGGSTAHTVDVVLDRVRPGDLLVTLGAGDITTVGPAVLARLRAHDERS